MLRQGRKPGKIDENPSDCRARIKSEGTAFGGQEMKHVHSSVSNLHCYRDI